MPTTSSIGVSKNHDVEIFPPTFNNVVNAAVVGTQIAKTGGVAATWDAGASTIKLLVGDGRISCVVRNAGAAVAMIGLSVPHTSMSFAASNYMAYMTAVPSAVVYELGVIKATTPASPAIVNGDVVWVQRTGTVITYGVNNTTVYTSAVACPLGDIMGHICLYSVGAYIDSVTLTGITTPAVAIGGTGTATVTAFTTNVEIIPKPAEVFKAGVQALTPIGFLTADSGYSIDTSTNRLYNLAGQGTALGNWAQATAGQQPLWVPGAKPVIRFDRAKSDTLLGPGLPVGVAPYTLVLVWKAANVSDGVNVTSPFFNGASGGPGNDSHGLRVTIANQVEAWNYARSAAAMYALTTNMHVVIVRLSAAPQFLPRINGVDNAPAAAVTQTAPTVRSALGSVGFTYFQSMDFRHLIVFDRSLSTADLNTLSSLITLRDGIPA